MNIEEHADRNDLAVGETIVNEWVVSTLTDEEIVFTHSEDGVMLRISQRKPDEADLPFRVVRETKIGDVFRIGSMDWFDDSLDVVKGYALGYVERGEVL